MYKIDIQILEFVVRNVQTIQIYLLNIWLATACLVAMVRAAVSKQQSYNTSKQTA